LGITGLRKWAIALTICVLCITVSYYWIDRPVAYFVHNELRGYRDIFDVATRLPKLIGPFVTACTLVLGVRAVTRRHLTEIQTAIVLSALSLAVSDAPENWLILPSVAHGPRRGCKTVPRSSGMASTTSIHSTEALVSLLFHPVTWSPSAQLCRSFGSCGRASAPSTRSALQRSLLESWAVECGHSSNRDRIRCAS